VKNLIIALALVAMLAAPATAQTYQGSEKAFEKLYARDGVVSHGGFTASTGTMTAATAVTSDITATNKVTVTHSTRKLQSVWIPWRDFVSGVTTDSTTSLLVFGAGSPVSSDELNGSGIGGLKVGATNDEFAVLVPVPSNIKLDAAISVRVVMHIDAAADTGDSIAWALSYLPIVVGTTTLADATTAASPQFSAAPWAADGKLLLASGATIPASTLDGTQSFILMEFIPTLTGFSADEVTVLGVIVTYTRDYL
jgi:hypothetical protein